ncbi:MAG: SRPBCC family protein [Prochlorothrix sp.]
MQVEIEEPLDTVWEAWANLENMPQWMYWIHSVSILEDNPELSRWTLKSGPWEFSWLAQTLKVIPNQIIQWKSVDGLPNRGAIRFYDRKNSSIVKMTIAYGIPGPIGKLMDSLFLGRIVESTIRGDLERFRKFVVAQQGSV